MTSTQDLRGARRALAAFAVTALLVAACGGTATPSPQPTGRSSPGASGPAATGEETSPPSARPTPTDEPTEAPSDQPSEGPSGPPSGSPGPTASAGAAAACTGSADNRAFYEGVADAVAWDVYCAVLPAGWFVETGSFRLSAGGRMEISYKGPAGQRLALRQGYYCAGQTGCIPAGPDAGPASYGGRPARLVDAGNGAWLVVAEDGDLNWEARGTGMDGPTLAAYTAAFVRVGY